ncbi:hypothetical protein ASE26_14325 [Duganella sp. Root198D2]|nr:hypothetical protein ASE26_14325 [Duganella sp. Root198D2]
MRQLPFGFTWQEKPNVFPCIALCRGKLIDQTCWRNRLTVENDLVSDHRGMECLALDDDAQFGSLWQEYMLPLISSEQGLTALPAVANFAARSRR